MSSRRRIECLEGEVAAAFPEAAGFLGSTLVERFQAFMDGFRDMVDAGYILPGDRQDRLSEYERALRERGADLEALAAEFWRGEWQFVEDVLTDLVLLGSGDRSARP